jgi:2,4-dienoyl-CoA reductase (NADPH2)
MIGVSNFEKLMEPGFIGGLRTKNRIIKTAGGTGFAENGNPGEQMAVFYSAIAKGGVGLIIVENCAVEWPRGTHFIPTHFRFHDDGCIPYHSRLVDAIHKYDCPVFIQFMHAGPWLVPYEGMGVPERVAPSTIREDELPSNAWVPAKELSIPEIHELVDIFAKAAERAKKAGYDGVEINGSYYHLINGFISRFWNRRHDEYGCDSLENRTRFYCEVIREVKRRCGQQYPIATNINAVEFGLKNGTTLDEAMGIAPLLQAAGADLIQVRVTGYGEYMSLLIPEHILYPEPPKSLDLAQMDVSQGGKGILVPLAAAIKQHVSVPVACAGRLDPVLGEQILKEGKLDFIGMTRRLVADPELPNKVANGRLEDIAPCAGCGYCASSSSRMGDRQLRCRINASIGREQDYEIKPAKTKKRVLIAGGGLAGMEAARVSAARGHNVTLCEKERTLGGLLPLAAIVKGGEMESLLDTVRYYETQLTKLGVTVKLREKVDTAMIKNLRPDVLIIGTGGLNVALDIPGIDNRKVIRSERLYNMLKTAIRFFGPRALARLTKIWMPLGKRIVIIGGAIQGCQLAHFLVKRGRKVAIVDTAETLGDGLPFETTPRLFRWLREQGTLMLSGVTYEGITDEGLVVRTIGGERKILEADSIVVALPSVPDTRFFKSVENQASQVFQIGDCREFGLMHGAIADGWRIGRSI